MNMDSDIKNSDWIKSFRLDIQGPINLAEIMKKFNIPATDPDMTEGLARLDIYPWVDSLPRHVRETIRDAAKLKKRAKRKAKRMVDQI